MGKNSTKFAKVTAALEALTSVIGVIVAVSILSQIDYSDKKNFLFLILSLLAIPYALAAFWLWKGEKKGYMLSLILTGIAILDVDTEIFSFYLTNGFSINIEFGPILIDLWSLLIFIFLVIIGFTGYRVEPPAGGDATR